MIVHGLEIASLLPREPDGVFYMMATDQPRIRDGVMGRAKREGRDHRRAVAGEADDAVDTRGLHSLGESHRWLLLIGWSI